jgi:hypothetical protein
MNVHCAPIATEFRGGAKRREGPESEVAGLPALVLAGFAATLGGREAPFSNGDQK